MKILIITTKPNAVWNALSKKEGLDLYTVDCSSIGIPSIAECVKNAVREFKPELLLTYRCPYIIPESVYGTTLYGAYNIHPSLLPLHSGLNPWKSIMNDKSKLNGVTIHRIERVADAGEIFLQKSYSLEGLGFDEARQAADDLAGEMVVEFIGTIVKDV